MADIHNEDFEWKDPVLERFGEDDVLVAAYQDPAQVRQLIAAGAPVTPAAINAACYAGADETLRALLAVNCSPNARVIEDDNDHASGDESDAAPGSSSNPSTPEKRRYHPLYNASLGFSPRHDEKQRRRAVIAAFLTHGAAIFSTFSQHAWHTHPLPPGENLSDEDSLIETDPIEREDAGTDYENRQSDEYFSDPGQISRSVFHAILEDGLFAEPILNHPGLTFNMNHRDPQGRTLLHSACRNRCGADVLLGTLISEIQPPVDSRFVAPPASEQTAFHILRKRGGNLLARDANGKNLLYHLLEARTHTNSEGRPPFIRHTLAYVLAQAPELINAPDKHGTYPLHAALQRLRVFAVPSLWATVSPLEVIVRDLLDAGARPDVLDGRGNTALHYLAAAGLAE